MLAFVGCQLENKKESVAADREHFGLKGNVKEVEEKSYAIEREGSLTPKREFYTDYDFVYEFNAQGKLISEKKFLTNGKLYEVTTYDGHDKKLTQKQYINENQALTTVFEYDDAGEVISITKSNPDGSQYSKIENIYVNQRLKEKKQYGTSGKLKSKTIFNYDSLGNIIEEQHYNNQTLSYTMLFEYDDDNHKILEKQTDREGKIISETKYNYKDGNLVETIAYDGEGNEQYLEAKSYDKNGNILKSKVKDYVMGLETAEDAEYDDFNRMRVSNHFSNDDLMMTTEMNYDEANNLLIQTRMAFADGRLQKKDYSYTFDDQKNWIKKKIIIDDQEAFEIVRTIKYY